MLYIPVQYGPQLARSCENSKTGEGTIRTPCIYNNNNIVPNIYSLVSFDKRKSYPRLVLEGSIIPRSGKKRVGDFACSRVFFTARYRAVYRGYRRYRWGTVTVPSGRNPPKFKFEFKFKKMKKSIKITKK
jgi:hypothetical protein